MDASIVLSWKNLYFLNSASKMANWITVDIVKRARSRHEFARLVMGTIFLCL